MNPVIRSLSDWISYNSENIVGGAIVIAIIVFVAWLIRSDEIQKQEQRMSACIASGLTKAECERLDYYSLIKIKAKEDKKLLEKVGIEK